MSRILDLVEQVGSPAHAGIDRKMTLAQRAKFGFPRTRGDRPQLAVTDALVLQVPPHTRG